MAVVAALVAAWGALRKREEEEEIEKNRRREEKIEEEEEDEEDEEDEDDEEGKVARTYWGAVLPEPHFEVINGGIRLKGNALDVGDKGCRLFEEYMHATGLLDTCLKVDGKLVEDCNYYEIPTAITNRVLKEADEVMTLIDDGKLREDLDKKRYAPLMARRGTADAKKDINSGFISGRGRMVQDIVCQRKSKELGFNVRPLKTQEAVDMILTDKEFRDMTNYRNVMNMEVILVTDARNKYKPQVDLDIEKTPLSKCALVSPSTGWSENNHFYKNGLYVDGIQLTGGDGLIGGGYSFIGGDLLSIPVLKRCDH